jgi:hypothetical protein
MNWDERKAKAAERKRELAGKIESNELLIAAARFYLALLKPGQPVLASLVNERCKDLTRREKIHLRAARRVLGVELQERGRLMRLPRTYWRRLQRVGLDLTDFDEREKFESLNGELILDDAIRIFAGLHPDLLERVKDFLCGPEPVKAKLQPNLDDYGAYLQTRVVDHLAILREG